MVLGKLPVPGCLTNLDYNRVRAYCACSWCGWGLFGLFSLPGRSPERAIVLLSALALAIC